MPVVASITAHFPNGTVSGEFEDRGRRLTISRELVFVDGGLRVVVPVGFETDFNSVPRGLWNFFPPWEYPEAGVVHDYLYQFPAAFSRADVDAVHRRIMQIEGASRFLRTAAWLGIRAGGWKPWNTYRRRDG